MLGPYIIDEVRKHFWEALIEANLRFTLASLKGDAITESMIIQVKILSKCGKKDL